MRLNSTDAYEMKLKQLGCVVVVPHRDPVPILIRLQSCESSWALRCCRGQKRLIVFEYRTKKKNHHDVMVFCPLLESNQ